MLYLRRTGLVRPGVLLFVGLLQFNPLLADWSAPATLSSGGDAENVRLAVDPSGNAFANWQLSFANIALVQSAILPAGGSWTNPVDVSDPSDVVNDHELAIDWAGNAYAVWNPSDAGTPFILASWRPSNQYWSSSTILQYGSSQAAPKLAARYYGTAVAVWTGSNGTNTVIQAANYQNNAWVFPAIVVSDPTQNADNAAVGIDQNGDAIIVWESNNGSNTVIQTATCTAGVCSAPYILSYPSDNALASQVSVNSAGQAVVVWKRWNGGNWVIEAATLMNNSWWTMPVEISFPGQDADLPQIGIDQFGRAAAVWKRFDGSDFIVEGSASLGGGTWIRPLAISAAGENADTPYIAVNDQGQVATTWSRSDGSNAIAEASITTLDQAAASPSSFWSTPVDLSLAGADALNPRVTLDGSGNVIAAWQYGSPGAYSIQAVVGSNLFALK
jgi:hypothetical protein